jgi:hypothetical protein
MTDIIVTMARTLPVSEVVIACYEDPPDDWGSEDDFE